MKRFKKYRWIGTTILIIVGLWLLIWSSPGALQELVFSGMFLVLLFGYVFYTDTLDCLAELEDAIYKANKKTNFFNELEKEETSLLGGRRYSAISRALYFAEKRQNRQKENPPRPEALA